MPEQLNELGDEAFGRDHRFANGRRRGSERHDRERPGDHRCWERSGASSRRL